jgi:hypothetical protein
LFSIKVFLAIAAGTVGYFYKEGPDRDYEKKDRIIDRRRREER